MKRKILFSIILVSLFIFVGFIDPYASRIRPFTTVPSSCAENSIGYSMSLHGLYICTDTGYKLVDFGGSTTYAPIAATYITETSNGSLTNEFALSSLATGILKNTTTTGIPTIAIAGTDYQVPITAGDVITSGATSTIGASKVTNAMLAGSIAYSKLSLTGAILNTDLAGSIAYSKLSLTGAILNADLAGSIAYSKLSLTNSVVSGDIVSLVWSKITSTPTTFSGYGISDTSANFLAAITNETGSGLVVGNNTPTLITPILGVATATSINGLTITTSTGTITITNGKVVSFSNTLTFTGTDSSSVAFGAGGTVVYTGVTSLSSLATVGTITSGTWSGSFGVISGANLTNLTAANITGTNTLPDGVLSTNVPLLNANNSFTGSNRFGDAVGDSFSVGLTPPTVTTLYQGFIGTAFITGGTNAAGSEADFGLNAVYNSGFKYRLTDYAERIAFNTTGNGEITFSTAASGTAGNALTFTDRFVILQNGSFNILGSVTFGSGTPGIAGNGTLNTGSKDMAGKVTATGTGASTIVLTFANTFTHAPACVVTNETTANLVRPVSTTTTLTINATIVTNDSISYICTGY